MKSVECDIAILGGGLAGCLIALALHNQQPEVRTIIVEKGQKLGGNHIWSFFDSDIAGDHKYLVQPLIAHSWRDYDVIFPEHRRHLDALYNSITSDKLDEVTRKSLPEGSLYLGEEVLAASANTVVTASGKRIKAGAVIDARGTGDSEHLTGGWQKFMGQHLKLSKPHGLTRPIVMDASVEQVDGYRFVYCLPFGTHDIFVEDTYYSDSPDLDTQALSARITSYASDRGWDIAKVEYSETGVLPVVTGGDFKAYWDSTGPKTAKAGARAALFHPLTSYSLPDAVRFAHHIAAMDDLSEAAIADTAYNYAHQLWSKNSYYRLLSKMLFEAADPQDRYIILQRFYTLPQKLIKRFYAGQSTLFDKLRILAGKPPVRISRALAAILKR